MSAAPPRPSGRRPPGQVRSALIAAGLELARAGGEVVMTARTEAKGLDAVKAANPDLVEIAAHEAFRIPEVHIVADAPPRLTAWNVFRHKQLRLRRERIERRPQIRIGIVAHHQGVEVAAVRRCHRHAVGAADHVTVGQDQAVRRHNDARAGAAAPVAAGVHADNGRTEALDHVIYGARVGVEQPRVGGFDGIWDGFGVGFVKHWI